MYHIENAELLERMQYKISVNEFAKYIGLEFTSVEVGRVKAQLDLKKHHQQQNGYAHGGLLGTLCDIVAGYAAYSVIPTNRQVVTGEIKTSFFRAGKGPRLFAEGWVIKPGSRVVYCEAEVYQFNEKEEQKTVVKASTSMIVIGENF